MVYRVRGIFVIFVLLLFSNLVSAKPLLTIMPQDYTYHDQMVAVETSLTIPYTLTNNTPITLYQVTAMHLPSGITASTCNTLAANGGTCTLNLTVSKTITATPKIIRSQFEVCDRENRIRCTKVSSTKQINLEVVNNQAFIALSDIHLKDGLQTPITYGQNTGDTLWVSAKTELSTLISEKAPKFIILLGDLPAHHDIPNIERNIGAVLTGISGLPTIKNTQLPVFYSFGNNDSLIDDYGAFTDGQINLFSFDPQHNTPENRGWPALNANPDCSNSPTRACTYTTTSPMPNEHSEDMLYAQTEGYYSAYPLGTQAGFRLISLNSNIFSYRYLGRNQLQTTQTQIDWFARQLASARMNNEKVYIIMHIPASLDAFSNERDMWNDQLILNNHKKIRDAFLTLINQYKTTIKAIFGGHTHENEFRALYASQSSTTPIALEVIVPGVTPQHYNNPGMQVYLYNSNYDLTEAKTFYTLPAPDYWRTYSFRNDYACEKNTTMHQCVVKEILANLNVWKQASQPILGNIYEFNYVLRVVGYDPSPFSSWLAILSVIQVFPIDA